MVLGVLLELQSAAETNVIHHCEILNTNLGKVTALFEISRERKVTEIPLFL